MKLFETNHTFSYPWSILTAANWRKYPNELSAHVVSCDVLNREYDPQTGQLITERLICCQQNAPSFLRRMGLPIPEHAFFREISVVDPKTQHYSSITCNLTLRNVLTVKEMCKYQPHPSNPTGSTLFVQSCQATSSFAAVGRLIEDAAVKNFGMNAARGREALELVVRRIADEAREHLTTGLEGLFELHCDNRSPRAQQ